MQAEADAAAKEVQQTWCRGFKHDPECLFWTEEMGAVPPLVEETRINRDVIFRHLTWPGAASPLSRWFHQRSGAA